MDERSAPRLRSFGAALDRLDDALAQPKTEWTRDAAIQRCEFTFELAWKAVATLAEAQGVDARSPREAFKRAFALGWIDEEDVWLRMLDDRNRTTHTYHEAGGRGDLQAATGLCARPGRAEQGAVLGRLTSGHRWAGRLSVTKP